MGTSETNAEPMEPVEPRLELLGRCRADLGRDPRGAPRPA